MKAAVMSSINKVRGSPVKIETKPLMVLRTPKAKTRNGAENTFSTRQVRTNHLNLIKKFKKRNDDLAEDLRGSTGRESSFHLTAERRKSQASNFIDIQVQTADLETSAFETLIKHEETTIKASRQSPHKKAPPSFKQKLLLEAETIFQAPIKRDI